MIRNYTTIQRVVEALQYTGSADSIQELVELTGDYFASGVIRADVGEWVIKLGEDEFIVMTDEEFQLTYRQGGSIPGK